MDQRVQVENGKPSLTVVYHAGRAYCLLPIAGTPTTFRGQSLEINHYELLPITSCVAISVDEVYVDGRLLATIKEP